jgi:hypothetical protein
LLSAHRYLLPHQLRLGHYGRTNIAGYVPLLGDGARQLLLGGPDVGGEALLRFYVLHIYALPALLTLLLSVHLWRVRKDGFAIADRRAASSAGAVEAAVQDGTNDA